MSRKLRLFVAIDLPEDIRAKAADLIAGLSSQAKNAKWTKAENLHLTLVFLGSIEEERVGGFADALRETVSTREPLKLRVRGGGGFGARSHPRVLWMGIEGDLEALSSIHAELERRFVELGHVAETRDFSPHLTLARSREQRGERDFADVVERLESADLGEWTVNELVLFRSEPGPKGSKYTRVAAARLE